MKKFEQEQRLQRLEQKVNTLTWLSVAQTSMIGVMAVAYFARMWPMLVIVPLVAFPLLVLCRRMLPPWARRCGRFFGGLMLGSASSSPKGS